MRGQKSPRSHSRGRRSPPATPEYRLTVLGAATLTRTFPDQLPIHLLGPGKLLGLLSYLALAPTRRARVDDLVDVLWGSRDATAGAHDMRQAIWKLRRTLGRGAITCSRGEVVLRVKLAVDRDEFVTAIEQGALEQAVASYGGDFLAGFAIAEERFEQWVAAEAYRLRRLFTRGAEALARRALAAGRTGDAQRLARHARDADPHEEGTWALLLETLLATGDAARAAAEADLLERVLERDSRSPTPETHALLRRARHALAHGVASAPAARLAPALVGRHRELETLLGAWHGARRGAGRSLHVRGGTGLGKTRLLRELEGRLLAGGERVLYVLASFPVQRVLFGFLAELVTALADLPGSLGVTPAAAAALVALNPTLSSRFAAEPDPARDEEALRHRAQATRELIAAVSDEAPVALLCDDLQWADPASVQALTWALESLKTTRALCITTASTAAAGDASETVSVDPLPVEAIRDLVTSLAPLPRADWAARLPAWLHAATAGSPRRTLEWLERAIERGWLEHSTAGWRAVHPDKMVADLVVLPSKPAADLVVLPFDANPPDASHLAIGMTEGLIVDLSRMSPLSVIGLPSALRLRHMGGDVRALRRTIDVRYVVEGIVTTDADDLTVEIRVRDATTGDVQREHVIHGSRANQFALRAQAARAVIEALHVRSHFTQRAGAGRGSVADIHAYECYLRARQCILRLDRGDLERAMDILRQGLELSGENALLYATLGSLHWGLVNAGVSPDDAPLAIAEEYATKAFALEPDLPQAHVLAGLLARARGRVRDQVLHLRRGLELDPNNAEALLHLSTAYAMAGKTRAAAPMVARLLEVDPFTGLNHVAAAAVAACDGRFEEAVLAHRRSQEMDHSPPTRVMYGIALARAKQLDAAHRVFDQLALDEPNVFASQFGRFMQAALRGERDTARAIVTPLVETAAQRVEYLSWHMGVGYSLLGETERAITWLERAVSWGFMNYPFLMCDPLLEHVRRQPEFKPLAERTKRDWSAFDV